MSNKRINQKRKKKIPQPKKEDYIFIESDTEWLNTPSPFDELDEDWISIIVFFVFHVPVSKVSARAKSLKQYKWGSKSEKDDYKQLKRRLMKYGNMSKETYLCKDSWAKLKQAIIDNDLYSEFPQKISIERVAYRKSKSGETDSLLSHIRNSFAHGRLAFYEENDSTYIVMEDIDDKKHVSARMILSKTTLLRWKTIISSGPYVNDTEYDEKFGIGDNNG